MKSKTSSPRRLKNTQSQIYRAEFAAFLTELLPKCVTVGVTAALSRRDNQLQQLRNDLDSLDAEIAKWLEIPRPRKGLLVIAGMLRGIRERSTRIGVM